MTYGLIAERVGHSFSAEIHNALFGYDYELKAIPPENLESFMLSRDFKAINVTIPYKEAVIPYLDFVDETALSIGAVNTVVNRDGRLYGYNTDILGINALLDYSGIDLKSKKVLVLGSGGTSKTARCCAEMNGCEWVKRVSRSGRDGCITYESASSDYSDAEVIINTTPVGMFPNIGESPINLDAFPNLISVVDVVYNPLQTELVVSALNRGIKAAGGLYMLVAQAAFAAELFVGKKVDSERITEIYISLLKSKSNIVLVGMPSCGKSACGRKISEKTGMELLDTDKIIESDFGVTPAEIIETRGEPAFRDIESEAVKSASSRQGVVISTGGGAILRESNVNLLRGNGIIYYLDRELDFLTPTEDRPLSSTREAIEKRYNERYPIYMSVADKVIKCLDGAELNADLVLEDFRK